MRRLSALLNELDTVSPDVAWRLVDMLFHQRVVMVVGAMTFVLLGLVAYWGTGSGWYLAGAVATAMICGWRLHQIGDYCRPGRQGDPRLWAWRALRSGWLAAAGWGSWSAAVVFEHQSAIIAIIVGAQSGCLIGSAARSSSVRAVAAGQVIIMLIPMFTADLFAINVYLKIYSGFVALHLIAGLSMIRFLHDQALRRLQSDEANTALVAQLESANQDLEDFNSYLQEIATTDGLTGLANRRAFDLAAAQEWRRAARGQQQIALLLLDVDHFKSFNDRYGHPAGDECLRAIGAALAVVVHRPGDVAARYGGEEFAVLLPDTSADGAALIAAQIMAEVAAKAIVHEANATGRVTVSIGIATRLATRDSTMRSLIDAADAALYRAKRHGRCRFELATHTALLALR